MKKRTLWIAVIAFSAACSRPTQEGARPDESNRPANLVRMEVEAQKHAGLRVAPVEVSQLTEYLQVTGAVQPVDSQVAHVRPLARGRLDEVFARVGDRVRKGQALARYDNIEAGELVSQYASAEAELTRLRVQAAALARQTERNKSLSDIGAAPKKDYELSVAEQHGAEQHARAQESVLAGVATRLKRFGVNPSDDQGSPRTALQTPFDGVVIKVNAAPGRVIEPADELFTVADLSRVWVQAEVYEKDLGRIRAGRSASITVDTYPGEQFSGKIAYIADFLDPQTRTARVRCEVPNPGIRLKLDMFASVQLPTTFSRRALVVPLAALQQLDGKTVVFVRTGPTWFEVRAVKSGNTVLNQTEIVDGLKPGEPVVVQGAFHLKSIVAGKQLGEE